MDFHKKYLKYKYKYEKLKKIINGGTFMSDIIFETENFYVKKSKTFQLYDFYYKVKNRGVDSTGKIKNVYLEVLDIALASTKENLDQLYDPAASRHYCNYMAEKIYGGSECISYSNTNICNNTPCDSSIHGFDWWYSSFDSFKRDNKNHTLDIRYVSGSENFPWVVGIYNRDQDINLIRQYTYLENDFKSSFDTQNSAIYGQFDGNITSKVKIIGGLRFERRKADYTDNNGPAPEGFFCIAIYPRPESCLFNNQYSNSENFWGGKLSIQNKINERTMIYGLVSRGYKPGGINIDGKVNQENLNYKSETMWNYETGIKTSLVDETLFLQASLFYQDRDDVQTKQSLVTSIRSGIEGGECPCTFTDYIGNAASGTNYGFELELLWIINNKLEVSSSLGILETEFKNFQSYSHINADPANGISFDLSGRDQSHAPNYQLNFLINYNFNENIFINFNIESKDEFYFSDRHSSKSDSYTLLNFLIGYKLNTWEVNLFGKNLTDEDYQTRGFGSFGNDPRKFYITEPYNQYAAPRVIGISGKKSF